MTPKERLKRLESYSVCDNYREKEEDFREIEKAVEVLAVLKKHIEINEYKYNDKDQNCIDMLIPESDKCFKEIKEWYENE